ncbi:unnamed protein product [Chrysoparadoxa australica]
MGCCESCIKTAGRRQGYDAVPGGSGSQGRGGAPSFPPAKLSSSLSGSGVHAKQYGPPSSQETKQQPRHQPSQLQGYPNKSAAAGRGRSTRPVADQYKASRPNMYQAGTGRGQGQGMYMGRGRGGGVSGANGRPNANKASRGRGGTAIGRGLGRANMEETKSRCSAEAEVMSLFDIKEVLGVGSTSTCYRAVSKSTGKEFACKVVQKKALDVKYRGLLDQFQTEIMVLKQLQHPNIIHMEAVYESSTHIYLMMEMMKGGELFDFVVEKGTLSEDEASQMIGQVTSALAYMHASGVVHRDLKPENLLLTHKAKGAQIKVIDFGLSKVLVGNSAATSFLGTRGYLAPEMLQRKQYGAAVDMWALGVICFVLLCGCLPFDDDSGKINQASAMRKFVLRFPRWAKNLSPAAKDLLHKLLDVDPNTRATASEALSHPWLTGEGVQTGNMLESPKALRQLPKMGTPQGMRVTYGTPGRGYQDCAVDVRRQQDFQEQQREVIEQEEDAEWQTRQGGRGGHHKPHRKLSC